MEFEAMTDEQFYKTFMTIIKKAPKHSTYKFAMALFLLEYSNSAKPAKPYQVPYTKVARSFLRYYWSHVCRSKLRQGPKNQVPQIVSIITEEFGDGVYPRSFTHLNKKSGAKVKKCTDKIEKECLDDVVSRFQRINGRKQYVFYRYWSKKYHSSYNERLCIDMGMEINPAAVEFLNKNYTSLYNSVILEWVKFLEPKNFGAPNLARKVEARIKGPRDQHKFGKILSEFYKECFYCKEELKGKKIHVDHVIPYSYVAETEMWNAVLACQECNCHKLDKLPPEKFVENLLKQNEKCYPKIPALRESISRIHRGYLEDEISSDAIKSLKKNVEWHYQNAASAGYPRMERFPCSA